MKERPAYYAVIPANVRYDKRLCPSARLLYGEITALANSRGYCYATNGYFSDLYEVAPTTVSEWVSQLVNAKHVKVQQTPTGRRIYLRVPLREKPKGASEKAEGGLRKKPKQNTTLNTTVIKTVPSELMAAPSEVPKPSLHRSIQAAFESKSGTFTNYGCEGKAIKSIIEKVTKLCPDDPACFAMNMLDEFWRLRSNGDAFWNQQPFLPSALNANGIFTRVLEKLRAPVVDSSFERVMEIAGAKRQAELAARRNGK